VLPDAGEGSGVPAAEQRLDAADEVGLLVEASPGNDEGPVIWPDLLFQLLQSAHAEVDARGRKEGVGAASHDRMVPLCAASSEHAGLLPLLD
jgi:hypothetical protein